LVNLVRKKQINNIKSHLVIVSNRLRSVDLLYTVDWNMKNNQKSSAFISLVSAWKFAKYRNNNRILMEDLYKQMHLNYLYIVNQFNETYSDNFHNELHNHSINEN